jgi:hypothetical protein
VKREGEDDRVKPVEPPGVLPGTPAGEPSRGPGILPGTPTEESGGSGGTGESPPLDSERGFIPRERNDTPPGPRERGTKT